MTAHGDDPLGAELFGGQDGEESDRPVTHNGDGLARAGFGRHGTEPAGAEDIGRREEARDELIGRNVRRGDESAVGKRDASELGLRADPSHRLAVDAGALVAGSADLARVVGRDERSDYELAGLDGAHLTANVLDDSDILVPHRARPVSVF
jgi:hypothetical protein